MYLLKSLFVFFVFSTFLFAQCDELNNARFTIIENKVFDKQTNLTWMRCSVGSKWENSVGCNKYPQIMSFYEANDLEKKLINGWRIPTIEELRTIFDDKCEKNAINSQLFPDIKLLSNFTPYWSSTSVDNLPNLIYYVDFINKTMDVHSKGFSMFVRLVKSEK
ncbi:hypothetical protein CRV01_10355 [Arcobacter sp. CECT 8983]|uniref:Lcl C-terminal domain-containing protein n=1 Tax=Arcobacter sp. CECT 8983 TaxID=2044508 RepID=UPI00100BED13|nr:DUF1566 domain-containing protein [Arcobacter sp. CECT 8983]RXJ89014.1 hypothetical protein CRV01_10355 [Arcobacter sp. CECT 8983]